MNETSSRIGPYWLDKSEIGRLEPSSPLLRKFDIDQAVLVLAETAFKLGKEQSADLSRKVADDLKADKRRWSMFEFELAIDAICRPNVEQVRTKLNYSRVIGNELLYLVRDFPQVRAGRLHRVDEVISYCNRLRMPMRTLFTPVIVEGFESIGIVYMLHNTIAGRPQ